MKQLSLFPQSKKITIAVDEKHELVRLEEMLDWDELIEKVMDIRGKKIIRDTGREPHYRELLGVVALMAVKNMTYREAEDQVAHYVPARYLCNLMDARWNPDHVTIFEFTEMLGSDGMSEINQQVLQIARRCGFADSTSLMSDTTAQEAIRVHMKQFGEVPKEYGFDRGGYSKFNIKRVQKLGVTKVGIAPKGQDRWAVSEHDADYIKRERVKVEGCIGTLKTARYGFNRPNARSTRTMELLGQRSFIGFSLRKLVREQVKLETLLAAV